MDYEIRGENGFADVTVTLDAGEQLTAEPGAMVSYSPGMEVETHTGDGSLVDSAKRSVMGDESLFLNTFTATQRPGTIRLAPPGPGEVMARFLNQERMYAASGSFLAAEPNVTVDTSFSGAKNFFTGVDVFLLELGGVGTVFFDSYGSIERLDLETGEQINVDSDHIVAFDSSVRYDVERFGSLKSFALGGEGKIARFTGPGTVWIQNRDFENLADKISDELPRRKTGTGGISVDDFFG